MANEEQGKRAVNAVRNIHDRDQAVAHSEFLGDAAGAFAQRLLERNLPDGLVTDLSGCFVAELVNRWLDDPQWR